ncbi:hypothetical protein BGW80DRAFT_1173764 [Lactifluus volemus]|nr:hypothetical protein BGW80DRAFT_1173764 [Lactifluus volemus]
MQIISELRKRSPFTFASDESYPGFAILDDQEQEEIIQTLKKENDASDSKIRNFLDVLRLAFTLLHVIYLFRRTNPLNPFLSPAQPLRIPFDILFALVHIMALLDMGDCALYWSMCYRAKVYAITLVAPTYCVLTGKGLTNTAWWSFAFVAAALYHYFHSLILQGERNILELRVMRYNARGA